MSVAERRQMRTGRGIIEPINAPAFPRAIQRAYTGLRLTFTVIPIAAGLDKFFHLLTNWDHYVAPVVSTRLGQTTTHDFMLAVGVVEIIAGLLVAFIPRVGAFVVSAWLAVIVANLLIGGGYYDVAARDAGLCLGAFSLGQLALGIHRRP